MVAVSLKKKAQGDFVVMDPAKRGGARKAAILLMALGEETASQILKKLDKRSVEQISREIATLQEVDEAERKAVIEEFYTLGVARNFVIQGGMDYARKLLESSFGNAEAEDMLVAVKQSMRPSNWPGGSL